MALPGQIDLNDLMVFGAVAEAGSFTAGAERLGVAPAKVSLEIARLESQLGVALFTRTTRKVVLTEAGHALREDSLPLLQRLLASVANLQTADAELTGSLRIAAPVDHAVQLLSPALARFAAMHPRLHVDLRTSDRVSDLVGEGLDVAIRMGWLRDSSMRAVRLGGFDQYVVTSPAYLKTIEPPRMPEDLASLEWIALSLMRTPLTWPFTSDGQAPQTVHMKSRIRVDSPGALGALIRAGAGITIMEQYSVREDLASG
ncbi:LysR family transcriptional regulator, partial [Massilia cavernae]